MSVEQMLLEHLYLRDMDSGHERPSGAELSAAAGHAFEKLTPFFRHLIQMGRMNHTSRVGGGALYKRPAKHRDAIYSITTAGIARLEQLAGGDRLADIHRQRRDGRAAIAQEVH